MKISEDKALYKIAAYCSKAERAELDVKRKLENWEIDENAINRIVSRLKKENFLNEERFCKAFIKDKIQFNKWGKVKIIFELKKKHLSETVVKNCFDDLEKDVFEEPLMKVLSTKIKSLKAKDDYDRRMKLTRFALGRGYSFEQIKTCLSKLIDSGDDEDFELFS